MSRRFGLIGGFETAGAVLMIIIASLSVWGAFLLYKAIKGQRRPRGSEDDTNETGKEATGRGGGEDEGDWSKSTGSDDLGSEDWDVASHETIILSPANHTRTPSDLLEENLRKTTPENVKEPTAEPLTASSVGDTTGPAKDHVKCKHDGCDTAESIPVQSDVFAYQDDVSRPSEDEPENSLKDDTHDDEEPEIEPHVDVDEPSETESAQEILEAKNLPDQKCHSVEDLLDNTLLSQEIINKPYEEEIIVAKPALHISSDTTCADALSERTKIKVTEEATKPFESSIPCMNDLDSYCTDDNSDLLSNLVPVKVTPEKDVGSLQEVNASLNNSQTTVGNTDDRLATQQHLSSTFSNALTGPPQNYLGFTAPGSQGDSLALLQLAEDSKDGTKVTPADVSQKKNEISIMEAIMDSNEWLSTGPPDTRDLPWLTQTPSKADHRSISSSPFPATTSFGLPAEETMLHQDKTDMQEDTTTGVAKDEGDRSNKKVGTVLPMPQLVQVKFRVHYITHSPNQMLAVTGNQQELGSWESFVPLRSVENGFWFHAISLPLESQVEWKFILVEEGKIRRWEECENRYFAVTGQEDVIHLYKNWGYA